MSKRNAKTALDEITTNVLGELLAGDDDVAGFVFPVPVCVAIGRIFIAAARLGGLVTLYRGGPNDAHILSVRFGDIRKAVEIDEGEGTVTVLEHLANGLEQSYAKIHAARKAASNGLQATETPPP